MTNNEKSLVLPLLRGQAGFTLVELIVVTAVFIIVIIIAGDAFNKILTHSSLLTRRAESNIEGIVGLEMFRHDLNQAGFGLPWGFSGSIAPTYQEASSAPANNFNDAANGVPRAFLAGDNFAATSTNGPDGTDYLVLKGTPLARNEVSQKWTYVNYSTVGSSKPKQWSAGNLHNNDNVIVLRRVFTDNGVTNALVINGPAEFHTKFSKDGLGSSFAPTLQQETHYIYGITPGNNVRMPFNRTDYYVKRVNTSIPGMCANKTGVLYKATLNHDGGGLNEIPILDCVADMQVVFGWDMNEDGVVDTASNADGTSVSSSVSPVDVPGTIADAGLLRKRLKLVKVYLLVQDGGRDPKYTNTQSIIVGNKDLGEEALTKKYTVAQINVNNWTNYRWKVYRIVVSPKNLTLQ